MRQHRKSTSIFLPIENNFKLKIPTIKIVAFVWFRINYNTLSWIFSVNINVRPLFQKLKKKLLFYVNIIKKKK